jgi:hypothetical protein
MSNKPTDRANDYFHDAYQHAEKGARLMNYLRMGKDNKLVQHDDKERGEILLGEAISYIALGLQHLSTGLRATYVLLEEVNRKLSK